MFEIELKNPEEMGIKTKDRTINVNVAQSTISAGLTTGAIKGAGEFEIGDATITGTAIAGDVMYRIEIGGISIGVVGGNVRVKDLDELGPIDILGTSNNSVVGVIEPKILIPMGNMDFAELKADVKVEKRLKIKSEASLPVIMEIYKLD
jgi:hypothetical protein